MYLTNSLEEHHPDTGTLFAGWLSSEANEANHIKRDTPVMVVLGNPPYSGESSNKGEWIMNLMEDYKKEPGGKKKLQERNSKFINDDYAKFLRFGQHFIEKNDEGILAFINPHGYLDNPTFRGMRWHLLKTYDKVYTIDLHGNASKKETAPDGSKDENVFDIKQGVSINLFIRDGEKSSDNLCEVFHFDLYGSRSFKYDYLNKAKLQTVNWEEVQPREPFYLFKPKDHNLFTEYVKWISLKELFTTSRIGIQTHADSTVLGYEKSDLRRQIKDEGYNFNKQYISSVTYRPFDKRAYYNDHDLVERPRKSVSKHLDRKNLNFCFMKQYAYNVPYSYALITDNRIIDRVFISNKGAAYFAPLYLYNDQNGQQTLDGQPERRPNLDPEIVQKIAEGLGLEFVSEKPEGTVRTRHGVSPQGEQPKDFFAPIDLLDYIYAVLHSPSYREKYKEFLKIDFPRVPYPEDAEIFWRLVELGGELQQIHLLEHPVVEKFITTYPINGDNRITKCLTKTKPGFILDEENVRTCHGMSPQNNGPLGKIQINDEQYFGQVPKKAWEFYIGGYQPAQKWLKDRRDRELSFEDIQHYQKIIVA